MLRVLFPVGDGCSSVELGTQFGSREVSTVEAGANRAAAFELPFQGSIRIGPGSADSLGLYFPDRYGASVSRRSVGVSLLRSTRYPDPTADIGEHEFRYAIGPGSWWDSLGSPDGLLKSPIRACPRPEGAPREGIPFWSLLESGLAVEAIKLSEDGERLIVRVFSKGHSSERMPINWHLPVKHIEPVDALERPCPLDGFAHDYDRSLTTFRCRPFQIVTFAVTRAD